MLYIHPMQAEVDFIIFWYLPCAKTKMSNLMKYTNKATLKLY